MVLYYHLRKLIDLDFSVKLRSGLLSKCLSFCAYSSGCLNLAL